MGLLDQITTVAEDPGPWSLLIYGDWGCGKTVLAAGAQDNLILDIEGSRRSLLNHPELVKVPVLPVATFSDARQVVRDLQASRNHDHIKTITVDTVTRLQKKDLNNQMKLAFKKNSERDPDVPSEFEYTKNNRRISGLVEELLMMKRNIILLAHVKEEKDNEGTTLVIRPGTSPSLTGTLAEMVDGVFYMQATFDGRGTVTRTLKTVATRRLKAKNRFGTLPPEITNPHFSLIEEAAEKQRQIALNLITERS